MRGKGGGCVCGRITVVVVDVVVVVAFVVFGTILINRTNLMIFFIYFL